MPTFQLPGPDGGLYEVEAPDAQTAYSALHGSADTGDKYQQWARKSVAAENQQGLHGSLFSPPVVQGTQRKILQGLTGNFGDDAIAYANAATGKVGRDLTNIAAHNMPAGLANTIGISEKPDLPFSEHLKYQQARQKELNRLADQQSGVVGDVAGGLASALGISRLGKAGMTLMPQTAEGLGGLAKTMAAGGLEGAGYGAAYGAGEGLSLIHI